VLALEGYEKEVAKDHPKTTTQDESFDE